MGRTKLAWVVLAAVACSTPGCLIVGTVDHFRQDGIARAAFELDCDVAMLEARELATHQIGVQGCGKRAVYVWTGETWANNTVQPAEDVAPAPALGAP